MSNGKLPEIYYDSNDKSNNNMDLSQGGLPHYIVGKIDELNRYEQLPPTPPPTPQPHVKNEIIQFKLIKLRVLEIEKQLKSLLIDLDEMINHTNNNH